MKNSYISSFERGVRYRLNAVHAIVFVIVAALTFATLEYLNRTYSAINNSAYKYLTGFYQQERDIEILLLGDSQFEWGVDTAAFPDKAFNLSFGGINSIQSYYILKHEIDKMPNLKIVVIPLDHHSFHPFKTDRFEIFFVDRYVDWCELVPIKGPMIILNGLRFFTILDDTLGRKSLVEKAIRRLLGAKVITFKRLSTRGNPTKTVGLDKDLVLYLYKTLQLCHEHHVTVVTLSTPLTKEYTLSAEKKLYRINDIKRYFFDNPKYSDLIYRHLDYTAWNPDETQLYKDGHHLNAKGREAFTPVLMGELNAVMTDISRANPESLYRTGQ